MIFISHDLTSDTNLKYYNLCLNYRVLLKEGGMQVCVR